MSGVISEAGSKSGIIPQVACMDHWSLTNNATGNATPLSGWTRHGGTGAGGLGALVTESSGVFTLPMKGLWLIVWVQNYNHTADSRYIEGVIQDNSTGSWETRTYHYTNLRVASSTWYTGCTSQYVFNCDSTSHQVRFTQSAGASVVTMSGVTGCQLHFTLLNPHYGQMLTRS